MKIGNIFDIVTYRTKRYVYVPRKLGRDSNGKFNGKNRREYYYSVKDYTKPVTIGELFVENITKNNPLLERLKNSKGLVESGEEIYEELSYGSGK